MFVIPARVNGMQIAIAMFSLAQQQQSLIVGCMESLFDYGDVHQKVCDRPRL